MAEGSTFESYEYPIGISKSDNKFYKNRKVVFMAITGQSLADRDKYYYDTKADSVDQSKAGEVRCLITLPLPNDLSDNQTHDWSDTTYLDAISGVLSSTTGSAPVAGAGDGDGAGTGMRSTRSSDTGALVGSINAGLGAFTDMLGTRKPGINPGYFQNYERSVLRVFTFEYTFIPKSKKEALQICEIIRAFKQYSSPQKMTVDTIGKEAADVAGRLTGDTEGAGKLKTKIDKQVEELKNSSSGFISSVTDLLSNTSPFQMSPFVWHVVICNELIKEMSQIRTCACSNVSVRYGSGNFDTFEDGMPKVINLSLELKEMDLQFYNKYEKANVTEVFENPKPVDSNVTKTTTTTVSSEDYKYGYNPNSPVDSESLKYGGGTARQSAFPSDTASPTNTVFSDDLKYGYNPNSPVDSESLKYGGSSNTGTSLNAAKTQSSTAEVAGLKSFIRDAQDVVESYKVGGGLNLRQ